MADVYDVGDYLGITEPGQLTRRLKLAYYAQAWHLAWHGTPLFDAPVQAWSNGPVAPDLWNYARRPGGDAPGRGLTEVEAATIDAVVAYYGRYTGSKLSEMTHREAPWVEARGGIDEHAASDAVIPTGRMRTWATQEALHGRGPTYRGPQAPAPTHADLAAADRWVAVHDKAILDQLATR